MKIEPIKKTNRPKYAAALAALSMVPTLAGCGRKPVEITGLVAQPVESQEEPVALGGDVALSDAFINSAASNAFIEGFARQGITLEKTDAAADFAGNYDYPWFIDRANGILICGNDNVLRTERYRENGAEEFDWGFAGEAQYPHGEAEQITCRTAFVNVQKYWDEGFSADDAEQIAKDLLQITETEAEDEDRAEETE